MPTPRKRTMIEPTTVEVGGGQATAEQIETGIGDMGLHRTSLI
jgi:hypothetical protein